MWNSICNFLSDKLFFRSEFNSPLSKNDSEERVYGKRLKLSTPENDTSCSVRQTKSSRLPMQAKENVNNDDEEECCVVAEIPRRKIPGNSVNRISSELLLQSKSKKNDSHYPYSFCKEPSKKDDKEIELVKCVSNGSIRELTKAHGKNKFFSTERPSLSQSKIIKSNMSFRRYLKRKVNFLQESYRLNEKFQYIQLLQSHTCCNLIRVSPSIKKMRALPQSIPVVDLTSEKQVENENPCVAATSKKSLDDEDIQFVREVPGVRSFQDVLKIKLMNASETIEEILRKRSKTPISVILPEDNTVRVVDQDVSKKSCPETLEEKLRAFMKITGTGSPRVENSLEEQYSLPELTYEQEGKICDAFKPQPPNEILATNFGLQITRRDMQTLFGLNWLNDEIINFYMNLIVERSKNNNSLPKVYSFNTFFYPKLMSDGYMSLRRWTKQVDIFSYDLIIVPVHLGMHWCMSVIDFRCKCVQYYDSIGASNDSCLDKLLLYLKAESLDKKKVIFPTDDWEKTNVKNIPQQMNGSDCGVFSCMFAEHVTRDCAILFTQDDMPYFRKKMMENFM